MQFSLIHTSPGGGGGGSTDLLFCYPNSHPSAGSQERSDLAISGPAATERQARAAGGPGGAERAPGPPPPAAGSGPAPRAPTGGQGQPLPPARPRGELRGWRGSNRRAQPSDTAPHTGSRKNEINFKKRVEEERKAASAQSPTKFLYYSKLGESCLAAESR